MSDDVIKWSPEGHGLLIGFGETFRWSIERQVGAEYAWRLLRRGGRFGNEPVVIGQLKTIAKAQDIAITLERGAHTWAEVGTHE